MSAKVIGLVGHPGKPGVVPLLHALKRDFAHHGVGLRVERSTAALAGQTDGATMRELGEHCDLIIVLGGDGTILNTVSALGCHLRPLFGINLGLLGFLTCVSSAEHHLAVEAIVTGNYVLSHRALLSVEIIRDHASDGKPEESLLGLNDAVISRGALSRLIQLETRVDGNLLTEYNADGLIVATPTGSTAYSLSAGGPLLTPDSGVFVITPICPHTLTNRSVIIGDQTCIEVRVRNARGDMFLTVDGQRNNTLGTCDSVRIRRAAARLPLAMLPHLTFFELARRKLKWSGSSV